MRKLLERGGRRVGREKGGPLWSREGFEKGGRDCGERNRCERVGRERVV